MGKITRWAGIGLWVLSSGAFASASGGPEPTAAAGGAVQPGWAIQAWASDTALSDGLPVLALDRPDWHQGLGAVQNPSRAAQRLQAGVQAQHASGWRMGWLGRSQVRIGLSGDAVELARLNAIGQDPAVGRAFAVQAQASGWTGQGLTVGTPWWSLAPAWGLRASLDGQWLQLSRLRRDALSGTVSYLGAGAYNAQMVADRTGPSVAGPTLAPPDAHGWGGSVSLALEAEPSPGWHLSVRAEDLWSRLNWGRLGRDRSTLNTQVTSRAPDGSLDFAPLVNGQLQLAPVNARMGARWSATVRRQMREDNGSWGHWSARWTHWAGMDETWLGWHSAAAPVGWQWQLALEPKRGVVALGAQWRGWQMGLATDGRPAASTRYRQWSLSWNQAL